MKGLEKINLGEKTPQNFQKKEAPKNWKANVGFKIWDQTPQEEAPDTPEYIEIEYKNGDPIAINGEKLSPANLLAKLNEYGNRHGIGRVDIVENRYVGMKARGCYETPGGTIMLKAHRAIESITLDREEAHLKDEIMPK